MSLVPIRVGMILESLKVEALSLTCPHTRGDDPRTLTKTGTVKNLSPYAWG